MRPSFHKWSTPWPPAVLDIEASGFGGRGYPIEIGIILPDGRAWCTLIRPEPEWTHWDTQAEALHGISRSQLVEAGRHVEEVASMLNHWLAGMQVYCDGWAHDYPWLHRLYDAAQGWPSFSLQSIRGLLTEEQAGRWADARREAEHGLAEKRHRASHDARIVQRALSLVSELPTVHTPVSL